MNEKLHVKIHFKLVSIELCFQEIKRLAPDSEKDTWQVASFAKTYKGI